MKRAFLLAFLVGCGHAAASTPVATTTTRSAELPIRESFVGAGSLEARTETGGKLRLALAKLAVTATTTGDVAETVVEHVFRNDSDATMEGTFRFPLPDGAILTGLAMEIDGKLMDGELVEREKARKAYEQVVDQMLDPALLEWENGQTFKLRVFPIEAKKNKRVVLRFLAPLHRSATGLAFVFHAPAPDALVALENVSLVVDGKPIAVEPKKATVVPVASSALEVVVEKADGETYYSAHVVPRLGGPRKASSNGQAVILLCDRSRSMLEARGLQKKTASLLLDKLGKDDRFTVVIGDVRAHALGGLRTATPDTKTAALAFVDGREPDGASDLGKLVAAAKDAVTEARAQKLDPVVVYLGDGTATWGETRPAELEKVASDLGAPMHVVMLGKSTDELVARGLAAGAHGRLLRPKTEPEAERTVTDVLAARERRRLDEVRILGADGLDLPVNVPATLYEGDELDLALRGTRKDDVRLVGRADGVEVVQKIDLDTAKPAKHVAQRWAKAKIEGLERDGDAKKDEIVATSLAHGVMSRYTAFLVLDSEEAYARFQIARKAKESANASVRADVDGDGHAASVSPDHLQPGDPEVRIPAPADASSVVVVFPFGETKTATWEESERTWIVRFLVDRQTPDGTYEITVRVTHHDGRVEILRLPYTVDTQRPNLDVTVVAKKGGYEIRAKQRLSEAEVDAQAPGLGTVAERRERFASVLTDAKRVEVRTPDGQVLSLVHVKLGEFVGQWTPSGPWDHAAKLRVVAVDRALNENVLEVPVR